MTLYAVHLSWNGGEKEEYAWVNWDLENANWLAKRVWRQFDPHWMDGTDVMCDQVRRWGEGGRSSRGG